jgi:cell division protein FtsB
MVKMDLKKVVANAWIGGRAKSLFILSLGFFLIVSLASYFKADGIRAVFDSDRKLRSKIEDLKKAEQQNTELQEKIKSVQDGTYLMEKYAREKLLLSKKDEMVFRFHDSAADPARKGE